MKFRDWGAGGIGSSVDWQEGKPGIFFQLFPVVGLASLQKSMELLALSRFPLTTLSTSSSILLVRLFVYVSFSSMTGIFQNSSDLWLENMVPVGEPGLGH